MKIINIFNEILLEDYKTQKERFIRQGFSPDIVNSYLEKFKSIRDAGYKELFFDNVNIDVPVNKWSDIDAYKNFRDLEVIVDYIRGLRPVDTATSKESIEVDGKPIFNNENIEIYFADTPRACIKYKGSLPYSWCVARSDSSNMFFTYRFKPYEPAFYFVKDKNEFKKQFSVTNVVKSLTGGFKFPYHFFVIQVPKNVNLNDNKSLQYIVTSANNDGDKKMSWDNIIKIKPELSSLKEYFQPKPFTPEEKTKFEKFKRGISDKDFLKLSYEQKREYLDIYPAIGRPITTNQFLNLPKDLKNLYVSFGVGLNNEQYNSIRDEKDLIKRYRQITERKYDEYMKREDWERNQLTLSYTELLTLGEDKIKNYLQTLDKRQVRDFIKNNGSYSIDFLKKYNSQFELKNEETIKLLFDASIGSEELVNKINDMIPEDFYIKFDGQKIIISEINGNLKELNSTYANEFFDRLGDRYWDPSGYYIDYDYFGGDEESLNRELEENIEKIIERGDLKDSFTYNNLEYSVSTIIDLLDTYNLKEKCFNIIVEVFGDAQYEATEREWTEIREEAMNIINFEDDDEVVIDLKSLVVYLINHEIDFLTTDENKFKKNLGYIFEEILDENGSVSSVDQVYDRLSEAQWNLGDINTEKIINEVEYNIEKALDNYETDNQTDSTPETKKLKTEVIYDLNNTLKKLNQDPNAQTIENEIVRIEIDRSNVDLSGKVFMTITNLETNETNSGMVPVKDLPSYFTNYKLFEEVKRIKQLL